MERTQLLLDGNAVGSRPGTTARGRSGSASLNFATPPEQVSEQPRAQENLPQPGSVAEAVALAGEFGIQVDVLSAAQMRSSYGRYDARYTPALFDHDTGRIVINTGMWNSIWNSRLANRIGEKIGWQASGNVNAIIHHEIGHARHFGSRTLTKAKAERIMGRPGKGIQRLIGKAVSRYAKTNRAEIVAEMYAGMKAGKAYSARLMRYYRALGGVAP